MLVPTAFSFLGHEGHSSKAGGTHLLKDPANGPVGGGFVAGNKDRRLGILLIARVQFLDERRGVHDIGTDGDGAVLLNTNVDDIRLEVVGRLFGIDKFHGPSLRLLQA